MQVRNGSGAALRAEALPAPAPARPQPAAPEGAAAAAARPGDVAVLAGIPEAELTPGVRGALDRLLAELHGLREELAQAHRRIVYLEDLADRDSLTAVLNRRAFVRELARIVAFAERYGAPSSVLYFDVDGMKRINDRHGHAAGDAVLTQVAATLLGGLRASDAVGRLGGDEFGVVLAQGDARAAAVKAAALAEAAAAVPVLWQGETLSVSLSYGVHSFADGEGVEQALAAADRAMYERKRRTAGLPGAE